MERIDINVYDNLYTLDLEKATSHELRHLIQTTFRIIIDKTGLFTNPDILLPVFTTEQQRRLVRQQGVNAVKQAKASKKISITAIIISVVALCISAYFSYIASENSNEWQTTQTEILERIETIMADPEDKRMRQSEIVILEEIRDRISIIEE